MVLVLGLAATPPGWMPTGMVAVTVIQPFAAPAVPRTEGGDAVAAVAASVSQVAAAVIRIAVRWVSFMMSCLPCLAPARACPPSRWACQTAPPGYAWLLRLSTKERVVVACLLATIGYPPGQGIVRRARGAGIRGGPPRPTASAVRRSPAYGLDELRGDLERFAFLPGGSDG